MFAFFRLLILGYILVCCDFMKNEINTIEVCFSPALYEHRLTTDNFVVVIVDILRATTSICAAFDNRVEAIIPVAGLDKARDYKADGYLVASERDGKVLDFADFGNSAFNFMTPAVRGEVIAYSTTNGTQAIEMARQARQVAIGAFTNLSALSRWLRAQQKNVVVLCAGWKRKFNLEDSLFAGALTEKLLQAPGFKTECDSAAAALELWHNGKNNLLQFADKAAHRYRLKKLGLDDVLEYSFTIDVSQSVPVLLGDRLVNVNNKA